jgi:hypothetical protein
MREAQYHSPMKRTVATGWATGCAGTNATQEPRHRQTTVRTHNNAQGD